MWPYVNGKALMSGINLREMEVGNMLDVLHFLFEEDNTFTSEEQAKSRSNLRVALYRDMYGTVYSHALKGGSGQGRAYSTAHSPQDFDDMSADESIKPFNPKELATKEFVPATKFDPAAANPFSGVLDAPLG